MAYPVVIKEKDKQRGTGFVFPAIDKAWEIIANRSMNNVSEMTSLLPTSIISSALAVPKEL